MTRRLSYRFLSGDDNDDTLTATTTATTDSADVIGFYSVSDIIISVTLYLLCLIFISYCICFHHRNSNRANQALKKKILRSLPKLTFTADSSPNFSDCSICLDEFVIGDEIRVLPPCNHAFHVYCIDLWLATHSSCPSCRQILEPDRCPGSGGAPASSSGGVTLATHSSCPSCRQILEPDRCPESGGAPASSSGGVTEIEI